MNKLSIMIDYFDFLCGGQYRIRTRVTGLEGQHDIQTTPIARDPLREPHLDEPSLRLKPARALRAPCRPSHSPPFPGMAALPANPLLLGELLEDPLSKPHQDRRVPQFRSGSNSTDYLCMQTIVIEKASRMQQLVSEGVPEEGLVIGKNRIQGYCNGARRST